MFALEDHITYQKELKVDDPLLVTLQVLDYDEKRVHYFMKMFHEEVKYLAATYEHLSMYVDFQSRRSAPMPGSAQPSSRRSTKRRRTCPGPRKRGER